MEHPLATTARPTESGLDHEMPCCVYTPKSCVELRREAVHLPLHDVVEDVVNGGVCLAKAALRRAHRLQPVHGDPSKHGHSESSHTKYSE